MFHFFLGTPVREEEVASKISDQSVNFCRSQMRSDKTSMVQQLPPSRMPRPRSLECLYGEEPASKPSLHMRRPASSESLVSVARQAAGGVASCLLVAGCAQGFVQDPELGMLVVSGRVDMLSAKVCSLPRAPSPMYDAVDAARAWPDTDAITDFLSDNSQAPRADEASCLASGSSMDDAVPHMVQRARRRNKSG